MARKEMSCIAAKTMLSYVSERLGAKAAAELAAAAGMSPEALQDEHHWMSFDAAQAMSARCQELLGDPMAPFRIGQESARLRTVGPLAAMARALGSPERAFRMSPHFNRQFTRVVAMEVEDVAEGFAIVHARYADAVTPHRNDCLYRQGVLTGIPVLWGLPAATIEEWGCASRGDARCTYAVKWQPLARRLRPILLAVAGGAGLATYGVLSAAPAVAVVAAPVAVGVLAGLGLRLDRLMRRERRVSREEFGALEEQLRSLERKGDALRLAREALEERVRALRSAAGHVQEVSGSLQVSEVAERTLARLAQALGAEGGVLAVWGGPGRGRIVALSGTSAAPLMGQDVPAVDLEGWAATSGLVREGAVPRVLSLVRGTEERGVAILALPPGSRPSEAALEVTDLLSAQAAIALENARLYQLAITDHLTGLYIRRYFQHRLEDEMARLARHGGSFAVLLMDLDRFKALNDTHGHGAGDAMLRETAAALQGCLRAKLDIVARHGGEEFAVLLPETDHAGALVAAEKVREAVATRPAIHDGRTLHVTASIGAAVCDGATHDTDWPLREADRALYEAKRLGRNRVVASWCTQEESNPQPSDP